MSSLAQQLQGIASLDAARLTSKTGAPSSKSYLFSAAEAADQDLDAIWAIASEGFEQLCQLDPDMLEFEEELFAERTKRIDRTMLNREDNDALDKVLERCLRRLGRWIGVLAGGKCIEWLIRRFRVHEMNVETLIQVFLPYHESQNFPRMLSILSIPPTSVYHAPFQPLIRTAQPVPRSYIVTAISPAKEPSLRLLRDVVGSVHLALQEGVAHRALLAFWSASIIELLESGRNGKGVKEGVVVALVEAFVEILYTPGAGQDVNAAVYPPLILLTRTIRLADEPFQAILSALLTPGTGAIGTQRILTLLVLLNDRKVWTAGLGDKAAEHLGQVKLLGDTLLAAMGKYGFEDAIGIVIGAMLDRPDVNAKHLRSVLDHPSLPAPIVKAAALKLISPNQDRFSGSTQPLLAALRERHPVNVDSVILESGAQVNIDATLSGKVATGQAFADVYSADVATRISSIKRVFETFGDDGNAADQASAKEAIRARLSDEDLPVVEAIYSHSDRLGEMYEVREIVQAVRPCFTATTPPAGVFAAHIRYLSVHAAGQEDMVFKQLLFPCLLAADARTPLGAETWAMLAEGALAAVSVIGKIARAVQQMDKAQSQDAVQLNMVVIKAVTGALVKSDQSAATIDFLVQQMTSTHTPSRMMALLILSAVVRSKKDHVLALTVLASLEQAGSNIATPSTQVTDFGDLAAVLHSVVASNGSANSVALANAALLDALTAVVRPADSVQWLENGRHAAPYARFASKVYAIANSTFVHPSLATKLLRSLLTQLGSDALLFFASTWSAPNDLTTPFLRIAALKHAAAFLRAHNSTKDKLDFQLLLPALLLAVQDTGKQVRAAALEVLSIIGQVKEVDDVYALDTIYGERSGQIQLMKPAFLEKYISSLTAASDELLLDSTRLTTLHASILGHAGGHNKKDTGIKRAMLASLVSQIVAWQSMNARTSLLQSMSEVHDAGLLKGVIPVWSGLVIDESDETRWLASHPAREQDGFIRVLGKTLDKGTGTALVNVEGESWRYFLGLMSSGPASRFGSRIRLLAQERIASGVFDILPPVQQIPYVSALLQSLHDLTTDEALASTAILKKLVLSADVLIQLLNDLAAPLESASSAVRKKQRQEDGVDVDRADLAVLDMTVLIESRMWKKVPAHAGIVAALLNIQSSVLAKKAVVKEGADYLEQEVLGAILALLERIADPAEVQKYHIGIEPIIKTIRTTTNPRTSQRALLVAAELARLVPDAVLHNVMPIFTFMGSTDLQRDDAYTFGVVEKTVKSIVPVLITSLRETAAFTGLDLWNAASAFIAIFTDMAARLPKHRTLPFFVHLVESLGAEEFLAPVSWLLIDRTTAKATKSAGTANLSQAIELALGVANSADRGARLVTLRETIVEAGRLMADLPNQEKSAFLSQFLKETDDASRTLRQITALFHFSTGIATSLVGKPTEQETVKTVVENLVGLLAHTRTPGMDGAEVQIALQRTLSEVMKLLSADNFLAVVVSVLASSDVSNAAIALDLFTERLPLIKREIRSKASTAVGSIVRKAADLFASAAAVPALAVIRAVTASALSGEDAALAVVAPKLVANARGQTDNRILAEELSLLENLARHLGPRIIPAIQPALVALLGFINSASASSNIVKASFSTLSALIETVPTFISGSQLSTVLLASIRARVKAEESSTAMISTCTKKILTRTIFPVVMDLWQEVQKLDETSMEAYFHLLRLTLKNADRAVLPTLLKTIFNFFLDVFDLRHRLQTSASFSLDIINRIEESAIGSFLELVTKLSEASFKPLFTRLYDWAVIDLADSKDDHSQKRLNERKTVLLHVMMGLLTKFKSLLSPYIGTLLPHIEELLPAYATGDATDPELWNLLIRVLGKSFEVDDGAFWTEALYLRLIPSLTAQIGVFPNRTRVSVSEALPYALGAMASSTTSEASLKALNTRICLATREEEVNVRLAALRVMEAVWERQAEEMVGLVPETVSEYLAELLEDENADVEAMARTVLARIEKVTGSLQEYLQ